MKKIFIVLIMCFIFTLLGCDKNLSLETKTKEIESSATSIEIKEIIGDINVKKSSTEKTYIEYQENEENYTLLFSFDEEDKEFKIERSDERNFIDKKKEIESTINLFVGSDNLEIEIEVTSGNISLSNVEASKIELESTSGDVDVSKYKGELSVEVTNGVMTISSSETTQLNLEGNNGNITVSDSKISERMTIITKNSEIMVSNSSFEKIYVENMNGKITLNKIDVETKLEVKSTTSEINVLLNGTRDDYTVKANSKIGKVVAESGVGKTEVKIENESGNITVKYNGK